MVEGPKLTEELLNSGLELEFLLTTQNWSDSHRSLSGISRVLKPSELDKFSLFPKANQVIAVAKYPESSNFKPDTSRYILVLDTIQDPGNLGTIIRTADWFGIDQIICSKETADIFNPKVVQASMGSVFRVSVYYANLPETLGKYPELPVYGTLLEGNDIKQIEFSKNGFIIIGNESKGISLELRKLVNKAVFIPKAKNSLTESLNASVACGILLSHLPK